MASTTGFEPGPHWWEASTLTTAPSHAPYIKLLQNILTIINLFLFKNQVCKLIDDSEKSKNPKVNISQDVITEWLLQNKVLSIAFESKFTIHYFVG